MTSAGAEHLAGRLDAVTAAYGLKLNKRQRVLLWLIIASKHDIVVTRFDAEHIGDHCLNSTIARIQKHDLLQIERQWTKRPTGYGADTDCCEYWLSPSDWQKAELVILGSCRGAQKTSR